MANMCVEVPTSEIATSISAQPSANTVMHGQNATPTIFQKVVNFVPGQSKNTLITSTAARENLETSGINNLPVSTCIAILYLLEKLLHNVNVKTNK